MSALSFPIATERLQLRPHTEADAAPLQAIYALPDLVRYLPCEVWTHDDAVAKVAEYIPRTDLDGDTAALALVIEHAQTVIGHVLLWLTDREHRVAEIGWVLDPAYGGQGYAFEAAKTLLDLAFDRYRVHRVVARLDARNTASARLADRLGMRREAHLRESEWAKGEWVDMLLFGMLAADRV